MRLLLPIVLLSFAAWATPTAHSQQVDDSPTTRHHRHNRALESYFPSFVTRKDLLESLTTAQCGTVIPRTKLARIYASHLTRYDDWKKTAQPELIENLVEDQKNRGRMSQTTRDTIFQLWQEAQAIEKNLFEDIRDDVPEDTQDRVDLAWEIQRTKYWGIRCDRVAATVVWAERIGQMDLIACLSSCVEVNLQDKQVLQHALKYEQERANLLKEQAKAGLSTEMRMYRASNMAQDWTMRRSAGNPDVRVNPQIGMGIAMALQIAPMVCSLNRITMLQKETSESLAEGLDPTQTWCLRAEMIAGSTLGGDQVDYKQKILDAWHRTSGNTEADRTRQKEIAEFQATDNERIIAWLNLLANQLHSQCDLLEPMLNLDTVDLDKVAHTIETQGGTFTRKFTPRDVLNARFELIQTYVGSLQSMAENAPPEALTPASP